MFKTTLLAILVLTAISPASAQVAVFRKSKLTSVKRANEAKVILSITDTKILIHSKKGSSIALEIPYTKIDAISYQFAKRHRISEGGALMALSPAAGGVLMATKTESHWLVIDYHDASAKHQTILQLDKSEYKQVIDTLEARTGRKIEAESARQSGLVPTAGSKNVNEVIPFPKAQVMSALKPAMEAEGCNVKKVKTSRIICKRPRGYSELTGEGGEKVVASVKATGNGSRVRIVTDKGFAGRVIKRNWSTPIFDQMMDRLKSAPANP